MHSMGKGHVCHVSKKPNKRARSCLSGSVCLLCNWSPRMHDRRPGTSSFLSPFSPRPPFLPFFPTPFPLWATHVDDGLDGGHCNAAQQSTTWCQQEQQPCSKGTSAHQGSSGQCSSKGNSTHTRSAAAKTKTTQAHQLWCLCANSTAAACVQCLQALRSHAFRSISCIPSTPRRSYP